MPPTQPVQLVRDPFISRVRPPGSKSLTNRALVLASLAEGRSSVRNALWADDTSVMVDGLRRLGVEVEEDVQGRTLHVTGHGGRLPATEAEINCGNSGTTIRFLSARCAAAHGRFVFDGVERMRQRPIDGLVTLLGQVGARCRHLLQDGCPPVEILADGLAGGIVRFGKARSSQFLSALLHVAPLARHETQVDLDWPIASWPYVEMTMRLMDEFGIMCELLRDPVTNEPMRIVVPRGEYRPAVVDIEPDASGASYFLAAAMLNPGSRVEVAGLGSRSVQGDAGFVRILERMGAWVRVSPTSTEVTGPEVIQPISVDLSDMPDMAQTLAVVCAFADGPSVLSGLGSLRDKETDRLAALEAELVKLGAGVEVKGESLHIRPTEASSARGSIATYDDHRMAMSFAVAGTRLPGVVIENPGCVSKTYPDFFRDLARVTLPSD